MWPDRASNPGPLVLVSDALQTELRLPMLVMSLCDLDCLTNLSSLSPRRLCNLLQLAHLRLRRRLKLS